MKSKLLLDNVSKIWQDQPFSGAQTTLELDLDFQKKVLSAFSVGEFYYYIMNVAEVRFEFISDGIFKVLGYEPGEVNVGLIGESIHPDDMSMILNNESTVISFFSKLDPAKYFKYKVRYDYRIKRKDGNYIRIMQQVMTINYSLDGGILHTFGVHTDISHLKKSNSSSLSIIGLDGEPSYFDYPVTNYEAIASSGIFTKREREVLNLVWEGKESKEIGSLLFISPETVNTHRRRMLSKSNCSNTIELLRFAIKEGLL